MAPAVRRPAELKAGDQQSASSGAASNNRFPAFPSGRLRQRLGDEAMTANEVNTRRRTCPLCEAMCGLTLEVSGGRVLGVRGDPADAFSGGYICPKAVGLMDIQHDGDRLSQPLRRRNGTWEAAGWDHAVAETVQRLGDIRRAHGDDAVAFYVGNPATHSYSATLAALAPHRSHGPAAARRQPANDDEHHGLEQPRHDPALRPRHRSHPPGGCQTGWRTPLARPRTARAGTQMRLEMRLRRQTLAQARRLGPAFAQVNGGGGGI